MPSTPFRALSTLVGAFTPSAETVRLPNMYPRLGEPLLELEQIQGNVLAGFNKDYQDFLFFDIDDVEQFKWWLGKHVGDVATCSEVLAFNNLFKDLKKRRGGRETIEATWFNIAFSYQGLQKLANDALEGQPKFEAAFCQGMWRRARDLDHGSGQDYGGWESGRDREPDVMLIIASDTESKLDAEVKYLIEGIGTPDNRITCRRGRVNRQHPGHEPFGFKDSISQPGIYGVRSYGVRSGLPTDTVTERTNPYRADTQGAPGQALVQPGEFVFGYPRETPESEANPGPRSTGSDGAAMEAPHDDTRGPVWAKNGSFVVFRKLEQDVDAFEEWLRQQQRSSGAPREYAAARVVGRWRSGAPLMLAPNTDDPELGRDECARNDFVYMRGGSSLQPPPGTLPIDPTPAGMCPAPAIVSAGDPNGRICPFTAHIRVAYPRDQGAPPGSSPDNPYDARQWPSQKHRLLRRGIPYEDESGKRGLLFVSYQASIEDQFERVLKELKDKDNLLRGSTKADTERKWVRLREGGYYFSPSIAALEGLARGTLAQARRPRSQAQQPQSQATSNLANLAYQLGYYILTQIPYGPFVKFDTNFYSESRIQREGLTREYSLVGGQDQQPQAFAVTKLNLLQTLSCSWIPFKPVPRWKLWKSLNRATKVLKIDYRYHPVDKPDTVLQSSLFCCFGGPGHE